MTEDLYPWQKLTNREDIIFRALCNLINAISCDDVSAKRIAQAIGKWGK